jgi:glutaminyl-peptide cyclotransferase
LQRKFCIRFREHIFYELMPAAITIWKRYIINSPYNYFLTPIVRLRGIKTSVFDGAASRQLAILRIALISNTASQNCLQWFLMKKRALIFSFLALDLLVAIGLVTWYFWPRPATFDGERAYQDVVAQVGFGARIPGSQAHASAIEYIQRELSVAGWESHVETQEISGQTAQNIVATRSSKAPTLLLGAHYDSRLYADNDPDPANHSVPVPGANDGASGVAVLLELARSLPKDSIPVWLVFFDIEDNGRIEGWDWILGSRAFAGSLTAQPKAVVVVDMIGDAGLNIFMEKNSDAEYTRQIWATAKRLGYESAFIPATKYRVLDDHVPFIEKGLRAVDLIDLDYPYWHTLQDTADKVSAKSLQMVGETLLVWIRNFEP